jgi:diaminohydroxyphosphoribosylaminopyrimidine deaminase / 5-amino-6-(5-phosphoribosylamino)uracil reductase
MLIDHAYYMELALDEARKGLGRTSPNPNVGAVIVSNGKLVGRGYHQKAGTAHAEVNAIIDAGASTSNSTLYVTLEPCNHAGRTPPCTEAILRSGITKIVIGMLDPNPHVTGGGADYLRAKGVEVHCGVLEQQCRALNRPFLKHSATGLPWIIMKAGLSLDGKITLHRRQGEALTGPESKRYVHQLRNQVDSILIGVETAIIDDPSLTTRLENAGETRDPLRIVLDSSLRLPVDSRMLRQDSDAATWIFCGEKVSDKKEAQLIARGAKVHRLPINVAGRVDLSALLSFLGKKQLTSVLVEGGAQVHGAFYRQNLVDELILLYAPFIAGDNGTPLVQGYSLDNRTDAPILGDVSFQPLGNDMLFTAIVQKEQTLTAR